jgi:hypothetical protein
VHFAWQLLQWPIPAATLARIDLRLEPEGGVPASSITHATDDEQGPGTLIEEPPPHQQAARGETTRCFRASKRRRRPEHEDRALGLAGELLVLHRERQALVAAGRADLAEQVAHTAVIEGDGAGFDIASFFPDGRRKYVEVKTTTEAKETDFFISANEVAFATACPDRYELCRVFDYNRQLDNGRCYTIPGTLFQTLTLTATQFRVGQLSAG